MFTLAPDFHFLIQIRWEVEWEAMMALVFGPLPLEPTWKFPFQSPGFHPTLFQLCRYWGNEPAHRVCLLTHCALSLR